MLPVSASFSSQNGGEMTNFLFQIDVTGEGLRNFFPEQLAKSFAQPVYGDASGALAD